MHSLHKKRCKESWKVSNVVTPPIKIQTGSSMWQGKASHRPPTLHQRQNIIPFNCLATGYFLFNLDLRHHQHLDQKRFYFSLWHLELLKAHNSLVFSSIQGTLLTLQVNTKGRCVNWHGHNNRASCAVPKDFNRCTMWVHRKLLQQDSQYLFNNTQLVIQISLAACTLNGMQL